MYIMDVEISDATLVGAALKNLVFPTILIVIGGILANHFYPRWQARQSRINAQDARRYELYEDILAQMSLYITNWRRLIEIAEFEVELRREEGSDTSQGDQKVLANRIQELKSRKEQIVLHRGDARDRMLDSIARLKIYASHEACDVLDDFCSWDEEQSKKRLNDLPSISSWRDWESRVIAAIRSSASL